MDTVTKISTCGIKSDCEAQEIEILLLQGKGLEPREYRISRPVDLRVPERLPYKKLTALAIQTLFGDAQ